MDHNKSVRWPLARKEGLVVRELADELLVYDTRRDRAHCLNKTASLVWQRCDGLTSTSEMAHLLSLELETEISQEFVFYALEQLNRDHLLEERVSFPLAAQAVNRRQMMRTLGVAAAVAVPVVSSIIAPTAAQAATQQGPGGPCTVPADCLSGICSGGICT
jgi:hypothetical protein